MKKIIIISILGLFSIFLLEYFVQDNKNSVIKNKQLSQQDKAKLIGRHFEPKSTKNLEKKDVQSIEEIEKEIFMYNQKIKKFANFDYEQFTQDQLQLFSKLNLERAKLLRKKVLIKYKESL